MAEDGGGKVIVGGSQTVDIDDKFLSPTVILEPPRSSRILNEEIFGCILPILAYDTTEEAVNYINSKRGTPLALYAFTNNNSQFQQILDSVPSGGSVRNDVLLHFATSTLPFGGLGTSGYGNAHGIHGFRSFTHKRGVLDKPCHPAFEFGGIRYPQYQKDYRTESKEDNDTSSSHHNSLFLYYQELHC